MKILLLLLILPLAALGQAPNSSLYAKGFNACFEKAISNNEKTLKSEPLIASYDEDLRRYLPKKLAEVEVEYLNDWELAKKYKELPKNERKQGIRVIKIFPLYDANDKLVFAANFYWFTYSEKGGFFTSRKFNFGWALEGGCHAYIVFNSAQKEFEIEKVEGWGV